MPIREMLSYHLDAHHKRSFVTYPYLYLSGDGYFELTNRILNEIINNNSSEDICIIPFIGNKREFLNYDIRYGFDENSDIPELEGMIRRRYDYVIENNIYSLTEIDRVDLPLLFLIFDETVDPNYLKELMKDAKRLGIFIIMLNNQEEQRIPTELITRFSEVILTTITDNGYLAIQGMEYKYSILTEM